jgi:hypothetical protein
LAKTSKQTQPGPTVRLSVDERILLTDALGRAEGIPLKIITLLAKFCELIEVPEKEFAQVGIRQLPNGSKFVPQTSEVTSFFASEKSFSLAMETLNLVVGILPQIPNLAMRHMGLTKTIEKMEAAKQL